MKNKLKDKVAIITGAGGGIGEAIANKFSLEGSKVVVNVYKNIRGGIETVRTIESNGGEAFFVKADVSVESEVKEMVEKTIEKYKKVDILVNNSGVGPDNHPDIVTAISEKDWEKVLNINLKGVLFTTKYCIPNMINNGGGSIINIASIHGILGYPNNSSYCASKAAIINLTRAMVLDYSKYNIRINCICPGFIETKMYENNLKRFKNREEAEKYFFQMHPQNRVGKPLEVAEAAVFLASIDSNFITGICLPVDGGYIAYGGRKIKW